MTRDQHQRDVQDRLRARHRQNLRYANQVRRVCVAVCCSVLQCVAVCCSARMRLESKESVLQHVAVCCSVLQCVAVCCSARMRLKSKETCQSAKRPIRETNGSCNIEFVQDIATSTICGKPVKRDVAICKETYSRDLHSRDVQN